MAHRSDPAHLQSSFLHGDGFVSFVRFVANKERQSCLPRLFHSLSDALQIWVGGFASQAELCTATSGSNLDVWQLHDAVIAPDLAPLPEKLANPYLLLPALQPVVPCWISLRVVLI